MKKYSEFSASDFVADDAFLNWVLKPSNENRTFWENWLDEHPEKKEEVDLAIAMIKSLKFEENSSLNTFQKNRLLEKINTGIDEKNSAGRSFPFPKGSKKTLQVIASGVAACFAIFLVLNFFGINQDIDRVTASTPFAEKKELLLPDGSTVILNANSSISYSEDWGEAAEREVWLQGEAFFEVVKAYNESKTSVPFVVHSENLDVKVLGTSFNVGERRGHTEVTLVTGKVKLENKLKKNDSQYLEPGEHAEISVSDREIKKSVVDTEKYSSWIDDKIIFEKTALLEIKNVLQDHFGYEVIFQDEEITDRKFTGVIKTDNLDVFLRTLEISFDVEVTRQKGKIILNKN